MTKAERIVGKKLIGRKIFYQIKWVGEMHQKNTWIPRLDLTHQTQLIQKYQAEQRQRSVSLQKEFISNKHKKKTHRRIIQQSQTAKITKIQNLIINIKTDRQTRPHWVFGNEVRKVIAKVYQKKYKVEWDDGTQTIQSQEIILNKCPRQLCYYYEGLLGIATKLKKQKSYVKLEFIEDSQQQSQSDD